MGCPPRTRMLATTVDFLKESGQVLLVMTGPPLRCHPWHLPANANIVFALPLRLNHFPRKSHSLRRIYVRGSSPFLLETSRHNVKSLRVWKACFATDTHAMKSLWVWEACFVADIHAMKSLWVCVACFATDTHAMESLWVWEAYFVTDTHAMKSLRVSEACFVADTHAMESLWVWEACFVADTQILKTGSYNKGTIYSKMSAVGVLCFGSMQKNRVVRH